MAGENTQAEELYEVACLLLAALKAARRFMGSSVPSVDALIRRAEEATKVRPQ